MQRAKKIAPIVREMRERGISLEKMARELNARGIATARGGRWHASILFRVVRRIEKD